MPGSYVRVKGATQFRDVTTKLSRQPGQDRPSSLASPDGRNCSRASHLQCRLYRPSGHREIVEKTQQGLIRLELPCHVVPFCGQSAPASDPHSERESDSRWQRDLDGHLAEAIDAKDGGIFGRRLRRSLPRSKGRSLPFSLLATGGLSHRQFLSYFLLWRQADFRCDLKRAKVRAIDPPINLVSFCKCETPLRAEGPTVFLRRGRSGNFALS